MREAAKGREESAVQESPHHSNGCSTGITKLLWHGGSTYDAWFTASTTQIAQVLLTFPYSFAQMGLGAGICFQLLYGAFGYWACYVTTCLYSEYMRKVSIDNALQQHPKVPRHTTQWFEVLGGLLGPWWKTLALCFSTTYLFTGATIQLIACGSNVYYLNNSLDKRTWTFIFGACCTVTVLIPTARNYRLWSFVGITMTTYTAWYLTGAAIAHGQDNGVKHTGPHNSVQYFTGATNMLYAFGGHSVSVEIMDAMWKPSAYKYVYFFVVLYTLSLTLPSVLSRTKFRDAAVVLMLIHQFIEFGLIALPIYFMWEKLLGVHQSSYFLRIVSRIPVVVAICFLAIMIPFFGPINSTVGALLASVSVYIIPCTAHMVYFKDAFSRKYAVEQPPKCLSNWVAIFCLDFGTVLWVFIVGTCFGAWASISNFMDSIHSFGLFARCYQCPSSMK